MKTALITGGARRIGLAIAKDLAECGFNVGFQYTSSEQEAHNLEQDLQASGVRASAFESDLTDHRAAEALFDNAVSKLGPIDLLINNASIFEDDNVFQFDNELWDQHFAIHLKAPVLLAGKMAQQDIDQGLVVNIIDQRVLRLNPNFLSYTLSKSALWTATRTLAQALAPRFRVNAIGPGPTLKNERQDSLDFEQQIDGLLLKRGPELNEFGKTIRYLYEARSVTGQMIALDGGQHLAWETPDIAGIRE